MRIILLPLLVFFFLVQAAYSQTKSALSKQIPVEDPFQNKAILSHYSVAELQSIKDNNIEKFNTIVYYYTESFILEKISCSDCITVDLDEFDVFKFEKFRLKDKRYVREYDKYGAKLTLLSIDELTYKLPIHLQ